MKRHFSPMKAQQAPSVALQVCASGAAQCASRSAHLRKGGAYRRISRAAITVSAVLPQLLNRLARAQPSAPSEAAGGRTVSGTPAAPWVSSAMSALHQGDAAVVDVHQER